MRVSIPRLGEPPDSPFPTPEEIAHTEGLVAWGGDLHVTRLLNAYRQGIFPWFEPNGPLLWWSPDPRPIIVPGRMHIARRLRRELRQQTFRITLDQAFASVIAACAAPRADEHCGWLTLDMQQAYTRLHQMGYAHSIEVWHDDQLSGGVYGVALGRMFFAESKFHRRTNASKIALAVLQRCLQQWQYLALDCQIWNPHLQRLGVEILPRPEFMALLREAVDLPDQHGSWQARLESVDWQNW